MKHLSLPIERDGFMRSLIQQLAEALEEVVGVEEASGYISLVGQSMARSINQLYLDACGQDKLRPEQLKEVLVDFKSRIQGDFYVIEESQDRLVLGNRACPFGEKVVGHSSMCMMTSNLFGYIAAENLGYSKVSLEETIARGDAGCRVVIHFDPETAAMPGREYFGD